MSQRLTFIHWRRLLHFAAQCQGDAFTQLAQSTLTDKDSPILIKLTLIFTGVCIDSCWQGSRNNSRPLDLQIVNESHRSHEDSNCDDQVALVRCAFCILKSLGIHNLAPNTQCAPPHHPLISHCGGLPALRCQEDRMSISPIFIQLRQANELEYTLIS